MPLKLRGATIEINDVLEVVLIKDGMCRIAHFDTEAEADAWIDEQTADESSRVDWLAEDE